jgi:hypothetical protein
MLVFLWFRFERATDITETFDKHPQDAQNAVACGGGPAGVRPKAEYIVPGAPYKRKTPPLWRRFSFVRLFARLRTCDEIIWLVHTWNQVVSKNIFNVHFEYPPVPGLGNATLHTGNKPTQSAQNGHRANPQSGWVIVPGVPYANNLLSIMEDSWPISNHMSHTLLYSYGIFSVLVFPRFDEWKQGFDSNNG